MPRNTFGLDPHKAIPIQCVHCSVRLALEVDAWGVNLDMIDQEIVCPLCKKAQEIATHGTVTKITRWVNPRRRLE